MASTRKCQIQQHISSIQADRLFPLFRAGSWVPTQQNVASTEAHRHAKCHNRHGPKFGGSAPFLGRGAGSLCNTKSPRSRPTSIPSGILIHPAIWPQQIWAKNWGLCPFGGGGAGSPSNTMWPGPRPTCTPSFILIHPTVGPQYTNVTDRTDRQTDNGLIAYGETFYKRSPTNAT